MAFYAAIQELDMAIAMLDRARVKRREIAMHVNGAVVCMPEDNAPIRKFYAGGKSGLCLLARIASHCF
jgi:hypothetical protein